MDMTLYEYGLYMEAAELKMNDKRLELHEQAWAYQAVKSTKGGKNPKPVYPTFNKFFFKTYQKNEKRIRERYEPGTHVAKKTEFTKSDFEFLDRLQGRMN